MAHKKLIKKRLMVEELVGWRRGSGAEWRSAVGGLEVFGGAGEGHECGDGEGRRRLFGGDAGTGRKREI